MKNIYLDQMIYSYLTQDKNKFGFSIEELGKRLNGYNLLISTANLYELAQLSSSLDRVITALENCNILFLPLAYQIQDEQLTELIYKKHFNHLYKPLIACEYISQLFTFIKPIPTNIPFNSSLHDYIRIFSSKYLTSIRRQTESVWLRHARELHRNKQSIPYKKVNEEGFRIRLKKFLSHLRDPSGKPIPQLSHENIINDLIDHIENNPEIIPTIHIENLFFEFRYSNNSRKPDKNDPRDIEHIICGLTNSDYFVTCDTNMLNFCNYAKDKYEKLPDCRDNLDFLCV